MPPAPAAPTASAAERRGRRAAALWRALLPAAWCVWLLAWLVPSLVAAPHLETPLAWLTAASAPAALVAGAAFFLVIVWPFWPAPAAAGPGRAVPAAPHRAPAAPRPSGDAAPEEADGLSPAWLGRSVLELVALAALAAPFFLVASSVGGAAIDPGRLAAAWGILSALALGFRFAHVGAGPAAARWWMLAALLACAAPVAVAYAAGETMHLEFPHLLEASPLVGPMRLALDGWPETFWPALAQLVLWPAVAAILVGVGLSEAAWRRRGASGP